jgi:hypothetical protein
MATRPASDNEKCAYCGDTIEKGTRAATVNTGSGDLVFHPLHLFSFARAVQREADSYADSHGNAHTFD